MSLAGIAEADYVDVTQDADGLPDFKSQEELDAYIAGMEADMREAAKKFEFEKAAKLRDTVRDLRTKEFLFTLSAAMASRFSPRASGISSSYVLHPWIRERHAV